MQFLLGGSSTAIVQWPIERGRHFLMGVTLSCQNRTNVSAKIFKSFQSIWWREKSNLKKNKNFHKMTLILHPALFLELVYKMLEVKEKVVTQWWVKCEMGQICLKLTHCPSSGVSAFNWSKLSTDVAQKHSLGHSACFYLSELT